MKTHQNIKLHEYFRGANIVVTGGVGSVGSEIVKQLLTLPVNEVRVFDNNETALFEAQQLYSEETRFKSYQGDIVNEWDTHRVFSDAHFVFHTAALKHVPSCETSPFNAVEVNVNGIRSIIKSAQRNNVKKVLFTSSDKAVSPTNVMGATKLLGERLFIAANHIHSRQNYGTVFANTRFGNVVGSRGSVVPLFCNQIKKGVPLTITDEKMTRFMMSLEEAANLVIESFVYTKAGDTMITKMPTMKIVDLARVLVSLVAPIYNKSQSEIPIKIIGARGGEKLWEELSTDEESRRILEGDRYLCVLPSAEEMKGDIESQYSELGLKRSNCIYNSHNEIKLNDSEIELFLMQYGVLPDDVRLRILNNKQKV